MKENNVQQRVINEYVSFGCTFGYQKNVLDYLPEDFHSHVPKKEELRPTLELVPPREKRNGRDEDSRSISADERQETEQSPYAEDIENIMEIFTHKGNVHEELGDFLKKAKAPKDVQ